jgi:hypothetical protein
MSAQASWAWENMMVTGFLTPEQPYLFKNFPILFCAARRGNEMFCVKILWSSVAYSLTKAVL